MSQRPLQLILARNFLASVSTPAFLVDAEGVIAYHNDAAGSILGRRFEESGPMPADEWLSTFGPFDGDGAPLAFDDLPLTRATRRGRGGHSTFSIRSVAGDEHRIEASAFPIVAEGGFQGAIVVFWPAGEAIA